MKEINKHVIYFHFKNNV